MTNDNDNDNAISYTRHLADLQSEILHPAYSNPDIVTAIAAIAAIASDTLQVSPWYRLAANPDHATDPTTSRVIRGSLVLPHSEVADLRADDSSTLLDGRPGDLYRVQRSNVLPWDTTAAHTITPECVRELVHRALYRRDTRELCAATTPARLITVLSARLSGFECGPLREATVRSASPQTTPVTPAALAFAVGLITAGVADPVSLIVLSGKARSEDRARAIVAAAQREIADRASRVASVDVETVRANSAIVVGEAGQ